MLLAESRPPHGSLMLGFPVINALEGSLRAGSSPALSTISFPRSISKII